MNVNLSNSWLINWNQSESTGLITEIIAQLIICHLFYILTSNSFCAPKSRWDEWAFSVYIELVDWWNTNAVVCLMIWIMLAVNKHECVKETHHIFCVVIIYVMSQDIWQMFILFVLIFNFTIYTHLYSL